MRRAYETRLKAARAFVRRGKFDGSVRVLGGGWWQVGSSAPVQGYPQLVRWLERRGLLYFDAGFVGGGERSGYRLRHAGEPEVRNA